MSKDFNKSIVVRVGENQLTGDKIVTVIFTQAVQFVADPEIKLMDSEAQKEYFELEIMKHKKTLYERVKATVNA